MYVDAMLCLLKRSVARGEKPNPLNAPPTSPGVTATKLHALRKSRCQVVVNKNSLNFFFSKLQRTSDSNFLKNKLHTVERYKTFRANNSADCVYDPVSHAHAPEPAARRKEGAQRNAVGSPSILNSANLYVRTYVLVCMVSMCACVLLALTFIDIECDGADCDAYHAFRVVEKLNGLGVQGKVISVLCVGERASEQGTALHCCTQNIDAHRDSKIC